MQVQVESPSAARRQVKVQVPASDVSRAWSQVVRKIGSRVRIPGFRPGKAPRRLLERRYGQAIREEVLDRVLPKAITDALAQAELQPLGRPELEDIGELKDATELDITFSCDVLPVLELTGYKGAEYTIDTCVADDEDVAAELETRRQRATEVVDVEDAAVTDDVVRLSFMLSEPKTDVAEDAESAEGAELQERRVPVGGSVKWLSDVVEGGIAGQRLSVEVDVPAHEGTDFDGKTALLTGKILGVQRRMVPDLDDALAVKLGFDDLAALRADAKHSCDVRAEQRSTSMRRKAVLDQILAHNEVDAPATLVNHEIDNRLQQMFGGMNIKDNPAFARYLGELRDNIRPEAEAGVKQALVLDYLGKKLDIEVTDADIDLRIEKLVSENPDLEARLRESYGSDEARGYLRSQILEDKAIELILAESTVTEGKVLPLREPDAAPEDSAAEGAEETTDAAPAEEAAEASADEAATDEAATDTAADEAATDAAAAE